MLEYNMSKKFYWHKLPDLNNKIEFEKMMKALNAFLDSEKISIAMKPFWSSFCLASAFGGDWVLEPTDTSTKPNDLLLRKVHDWFEVMYGNKLLADFSLCKLPIVIKKDLFSLKIPQYFKEPILLDKSEQEFQSNSIYVLELIENLTDNYIDVLTKTDRKQILQLTKKSILGINWLYNLAKDLPNTDFFNISFKDYKACCNNLLIHQNNHSAWDSLQATEKLIKGLLVHGGFTYHKSHNLIKLAQDLETKTQIKIDINLLNNLNFTHEVRYGEVLVSFEEALKANHSFILVLNKLSKSKVVKKYLK